MNAPHQTKVASLSVTELEPVNRKMKFSRYLPKKIPI